MKTQNERILEYLKPPGRSLTPLKALKMFGTFRLGARAYDLRKAGHPVHSEMVTVGKKRVAKYFML